MSMRIAIVGGGYSGFLTSLHLLAQAGKKSIEITLFDTAERPGRGLAYSTSDDNLLLNVPAGNMSAFGGDAGHFVRYCQTIDPAFHEGTFVSRRIYGDYLQSLIAQQQTSEDINFKTRCAKVTSVELLDDGKFLVKSGEHTHEVFDTVILALGHFESLNPVSQLLKISSHALINPSDTRSLANIEGTAPVLIIGTGLTAIDTIFKISSFDIGAKMIAISRRGLVSRPHRMHPKAPSLVPVEYIAELKPQIRVYLRKIREEIERIEAVGGDWRDVINQLRPFTPALWQNLSVFERKRFLRHVVPFWDVHRHRLAPMADQRLKNLVADRKVLFSTARILTAVKNDQGWLVELQYRKMQTIERMQVGAIVNCAGPNGDLTKIEDELVKQLLNAGLICPDPLRIGLLTSNIYEVLGANGKPTKRLFYVGPMLKATFWEAIAVPELRVHTETLAREVLK